MHGHPCPHPELIDPALWRRFDLVIEFPPPTTEATRIAITRFLGKETQDFSGWIGVLLQQVVRMIWRSQSVGG
jgi:SpoVK/Ycf46/Vps4 family AAA+-type ATPase